VHDQACGAFAGRQAEQLPERVRRLRDVKDQIPKEWPSFGTDNEEATLKVSWIGTDDGVRVRLPRPPPPGPSVEVPPDFLKELIGLLWSHRESVEGSCDELGWEQRRGARTSWLARRSR
jgi:hypothetical protein